MPLLVTNAGDVAGDGAPVPTQNIVTEKGFNIVTEDGTPLTTE